MVRIQGDAGDRRRRHVALDAIPGALRAGRPVPVRLRRPARAVRAGVEVQEGLPLGGGDRGVRDARREKED